jgi:hypothetical protein
VRRNYNRLWLTWSWGVNTTNVKVTPIFLLVESLGKLVNALDSEDSTKSIDDASRHYFVVCQVVVSNECLTWLIQAEIVWQFLPS